MQDGFVQNVHIPIVRVDPENRCAVMLVYGTKLVVLPFRKDTLTDEQEAVVGEGYAHLGMGHVQVTIAATNDFQNTLICSFHDTSQSWSVDYKSCI